MARLARAPVDGEAGRAVGDGPLLLGGAVVRAGEDGAGRHAKVDGVSVLGDGAEIAPGAHVAGVRIPEPPAS